MKVYYRPTDTRGHREFRVATPDKETSQSWHFDSIGCKVFKKGLTLKNNPSDYSSRYEIFLSLEDAEESAWVRKNRHLIESHMRSATYDQLKEIASIIGYEEPPPKANN